jgi:hypothetical protein
MQNILLKILKIPNRAASSRAPSDANFFPFVQSLNYDQSSFFSVIFLGEQLSIITLHFGITSINIRGHICT